jgi:ABC-type multidrug transport system fused ATPase/permease subunit
VSFSVEKGQCLCVLGRNGVGKTTLMQTIMGLTTAMKGQLMMDGVDMSARKTAERAMAGLGYVPQGRRILGKFTVRENILLGLDAGSAETNATAASMDRALQLAHAAQFVAALPKGLDNELGEGGSGLSGGQRQRLAIARALMRDPAVLILDEATSQIDAESEAQISAAIDEFRRGRTLIAIAHRLSTVRSADRIVVMDQGVILDAGSHGELLSRCELYQRLVATQLVS